MPRNIGSGVRRVSGPARASGGVGAGRGAWTAERFNLGGYDPTWWAVPFSLKTRAQKNAESGGSESDVLPGGVFVLTSNPNNGTSSLGSEFVEFDGTTVTVPEAFEIPDNDRIYIVIPMDYSIDDMEDGVSYTSPGTTEGQWGQSEDYPQPTSEVGMILDLTFPEASGGMRFTFFSGIPGTKQGILDQIASYEAAGFTVHDWYFANALQFWPAPPGTPYLPDTYEVPSPLLGFVETV